ncbi:hypothetical protein L2E82_29900 [Cichorium intybus]|uniref:Uncharacterized protein n=1 Tax=Cichorium intybus TaxID=13427 RepID=A0ACB9CYU9_CICIN|nr:hypothetical protein L2E82_29900 [Cichorium intybus]
MESTRDTDDERSVSRKKAKGTTGKVVSNSEIDIDSFFTHLLNSFNLSEVDTLRQTDSDKELVDRVIMVYKESMSEKASDSGH